MSDYKTTAADLERIFGLACVGFQRSCARRVAESNNFTFAQAIELCAVMIEETRQESIDTALQSRSILVTGMRKLHGMPAEDGSASIQPASIGHNSKANAGGGFLAEKMRTHHGTSVKKSNAEVSATGASAEKSLADQMRANHGMPAQSKTARPQKPKSQQDMMIDSLHAQGEKARADEHKSPSEKAQREAEAKREACAHADRERAQSAAAAAASAAQIAPKPASTASTAQTVQSAHVPAAASPPPVTTPKPASTATPAPAQKKSSYRARQEAEYELERKERDAQTALATKKREKALALKEAQIAGDTKLITSLKEELEYLK